LTNSAGRKQVRPPRAILPPENSLAVREQLIAELGTFRDTEALTAWAGRVLPQKNQLVTSDAEELETAFSAKLTELGDDGTAGPDLPLPGTNGGGGKDGEPATGDGSGGPPMAVSPRHSPSRKLNGHRAPWRPARGENGSAEGVKSKAVTRESVTPISKTLRLRDRDHLKFVSTQPCLACGRSPSDAHHLKFAQQRALGRQVSDEFTVPLCRAHHRELHQRGDERTWWQQLNLDPMPMAQRLWQHTRSNGRDAPTEGNPELEALRP
jgi:hypothetical protein